MAGRSGGAATDNGTRAGFAGFSDSWFGGRLETQAAAGYGSDNLDFFCIGDGPLNDSPIRYNLKPLIGLVDMHYRLGDTRAQVGMGYAIADTKVSFAGDLVPPQISARELDSRVAGVTPSFIYDTRNNFFTPTAGIYARADVGVFRQGQARDYNYEKVSLTFINYRPLSKTVTLGLKLESEFSFNDVPFYARPYISLRGVAARRFVGEDAADAELEARWQIWGRFSVLGFTGTGIDWNNFDHFHSTQTVVTGGVGVRYEIARKYGLHMGVDVGFGPDSPAIYVQFGSAWFRP